MMNVLKNVHAARKMALEREIFFLVDRAFQHLKLSNGLFLIKPNQAMCMTRVRLGLLIAQ